MNLPIPSYHKLTNANNVVYHFASADGLKYDSLSLFVDMYKKVKPSEIASCQKATIEGLPLTLTMIVHNFGMVQPDITLKSMKELTSSRKLNNVTSWSIEDNMLRLDINLSDFPYLTQAAEEGKPVKLLELNSVTVSKQCRLTLQIFSIGKAKWPLLQSPSRNSAPPGTPQLYSNSPVRLSNNNDAAAELGTKLLHISDCLTVDASNTSDVKVMFYPKYNRGNILTTSINLFKGITIRMLIDHIDKDDLRFKRKRTASGISKPLTNVKLKAGIDASRREKVLIIRFDADQSHGIVDFGSIPEFGTRAGASAENPSVSPLPRAHHRVYRVSECTKAREDNFIVDFVAVRMAAEVPTEREIYISIYKHLQFVKNFTSELNVDAIRTHLLLEYPYVATADLETQEKFSLLVWGGVREYAVNRVLGLRHTLLMDETNLLSEMLST